MTDISALEGYAGLLSEAALQSKGASALQHVYVNGGVDTDVLTESGPVPCIAKQARVYLETLPDAAADLSRSVANGRGYRSLAEGLAEPSVADGAQFWIRQSAPLTGQDLYRRTGAVAVFEGVSIAGSGEVKSVDARLTATGITQVPKGPLRNLWGLQLGSRMPLRVDEYGNSHLRLSVEDMHRKVPSSPASPQAGGELGLTIGDKLLANPAHIARAMKRPRGPKQLAPLLISVGGRVILQMGQADSGSISEAATAAQVRQAQQEFRAWDDVSWLTREISTDGKARVQVHDGLVWRDLFAAGDGFTDAAPTATGSTVRFLSDRTAGAGGALTPHAKLKSGELVSEAPVLWHHQGTGQSLSLGSRGFMIDANGAPLFEEGVFGEVFSKAPSPFKSRCLAFKGFGPRGYYGVGGAVPVSAYTEFEPLQERFEGGLLGETTMSGFANSMNRYLNERGTGMCYLCSISGVGGQPYSSLKKGTATFTSLVNMMTAARQIAQEHGMLYRVAPLSITHGESEPVGTTQAVYTASMRVGLVDYQAGVSALD